MKQENEMNLSIKQLWIVARALQCLLEFGILKDDYEKEVVEFYKEVKENILAG